MRSIPYTRPQLGRDFWLISDALPDPDAVAARARAREDWIQGFPHRPERWPGSRSRHALTPDELALVDDRVRAVTGEPSLGLGVAPAGAALDHNVFQLVGGAESGARPHTDARSLATFAGVLYLSPGAPLDAGTSFYRFRAPNGELGGNHVPPPFENLVDAMGVSRLPPEAWAEDMRVDNQYNLLLVYRANFVHSATRYFGRKPAARRLTALFFWLSPPAAEAAQGAEPPISSVIG